MFKFTFLVWAVPGKTCPYPQPVILRGDAFSQCVDDVDGKAPKVLEIEARRELICCLMSQGYVVQRVMLSSVNVFTGDFP